MVSVHTFISSQREASFVLVAGYYVARKRCTAKEKRRAIKWIREFGLRAVVIYTRHDVYRI